MNRRLLTGIGVLVALAGAVFTLQGLGVLGGSSMSGATLWAILGPIIVVVGVGLVSVGSRSR